MMRAYLHMLFLYAGLQQADPLHERAVYLLDKRKTGAYHVYA